MRLITDLIPSNLVLCLFVCLNFDPFFKKNSCSNCEDMMLDAVAFQNGLHVFPRKFD